MAAHFVMRGMEGENKHRWFGRIPLTLTILASALSLGGIGLHAIGMVFHRSYLSALGISPDLFPKSIDWMVICGYDVLATQWLAVFTLVMNHPFKTGLYCLFGLLVVAGYIAAFRWQPKINGLPNIPERLRTIVRTFAMSAAIAACIPGAVAIVMLALVLIYLPSQYAAKKQASADRAKFLKGCGPERCISISRQGHALATGIVVDASEHRMALYDPSNNQIRVLVIDGAEISGPLPTTSP